MHTSSKSMSANCYLCSKHGKVVWRGTDKPKPKPKKDK